MAKSFILAGLLASTLCLATPFMAVPCMALQTYPLVDQQSNTVIISKDQQNRIAVQGERIQQIFGTDGVFDVQSDDEGGQIFLKILDVSTAKPITITIITESGLTQDLKLIPKAIDAQSILLKVKQANKPNAIQAIKAMLLKQLPVEQPPRREYGHTKYGNIKVKPLSFYKEGDLEGGVYELTNTGKQTITLQEQDLALKDDVAISIPKKTLRPNEQGKLYVVSRRQP